MNKLFSISLIAFAFASCQGSDNSNTTDAAVSYPAAVATPPAAVADSTKIDIISTPALPATNTNSAVALNPAHGAPGHRCDIEVGAPLNAPASGGPAPAIGTGPAPVMLQNPPAANPNGNTVRLNPAHGAPGHDCSIPVGQPLRS